MLPLNSDNHTLTNSIYKYDSV